MIRQLDTVGSYHPPPPPLTKDCDNWLGQSWLYPSFHKLLQFTFKAFFIQLPYLLLRAICKIRAILLSLWRWKLVCDPVVYKCIATRVGNKRTVWGDDGDPSKRQVDQEYYFNIDYEVYSERQREGEQNLNTETGYQNSLHRMWDYHHITNFSEIQ